uniref:Uncharacterized protein LOC113791471 n=1 Tax=Dermatophagoides pteronyssinus TaxID=6956 RepID=A0A6P6XVQ3_DERPT|nr:uncharacterized protein LOC113791471 [Dermatophagoides pteronyssinus]
MDTAKRLAYLQQLQNLLIQQQSSSSSMNSNQNDSMIRLNSFYGYLGKEISMKHNLQILNCDPLKLYRCKRCYCQYNFQSIIRKNLLQIKTESKQRSICFQCPECSFKRKIIFRQLAKTKLEKYLQQLQQQQQSNDKK